MKRFFNIVFLLLLLNGIGLKAQKSSFVAGVEGGFALNSPAMAFDTPSYNGKKYALGSPIVAFMGGPFCIFNISSRIGLKTGIWYISERQTGSWAWDPDLPTIYGYGRQTIDYYSSEFRIPFFVRYSISLPRKNRCFIDFGPSFSFLNTRNELYVHNDSLGNIHAETNLSKGNSTAISAGLGIILAGNGNFNWSFEALYALNSGPVGYIGETFFGKAFFGEVYLLCGLNFDLSQKKTRWKSNNCTRF